MRLDQSPTARAQTPGAPVVPAAGVMPEAPRRSLSWSCQESVVSNQIDCAAVGRLARRKASAVGAPISTNSLAPAFRARSYWNRPPCTGAARVKAPALMAEAETTTGMPFGLKGNAGPAPVTGTTTSWVAPAAPATTRRSAAP